MKNEKKKNIKKQQIKALRTPWRGEKKCLAKLVFVIFQKIHTNSELLCPGLKLINLARRSKLTVF